MALISSRIKPERIKIIPKQEITDPKLMQTYENLTEIRDEEVLGLKPWVWIKGEEGVWGGPRNEFQGLHTLVLKHFNDRPKRVCIQAGGALGMYPRLWAKDFEQVFTFEPDPLNFYC